MTTLSSIFRVRRPGLTLIEILISIGVVAIGLLGVAILLPVAGRQALDGEIADQAALVGRNAFHEFLIRGMSRPEYWDMTTVPSTPTAVCIDPRFRLFTTAATTLPYSPAGTFASSMPRISLKRAPSAPGFPVPITAAEADELFQSTDDLTVERPSDRSQPATLMMSQRRQFDGVYSWFATLVPSPAPSAAASSVGGPLYVLSIAVAYRRVLEEPDRVFTVTFLSGGVGGGSVNLATTAANIADLDLVKENSWLLFSAGGNGFRWYRVVSSQEADPATNSAEVTVEGADWITPSTGVEAVLVPGVVAIYERTLRLESQSAWVAP